MPQGRERKKKKDFSVWKEENSLSCLPKCLVRGVVGGGGAAGRLKAKSLQPSSLLPSPPSLLRFLGAEVVRWFCRHTKRRPLFEYRRGCRQ